MQIVSSEAAEPFDMKRLAQMAAGDDDRIENAAIRLVGLDLPSAASAAAPLDRRRGCTTRAEADEGAKPELLDEARDIGVHVAMARERLRAFGEFEIPEVRELLRRVDVKRFIGRGEAVVVVEAPKAAHLRADLIDRHVKASLLEISRHAKA